MITVYNLYIHVSRFGPITHSSTSMVALKYFPQDKQFLSWGYEGPYEH